MPADPVSSGCGCALVLAVCAVYVAGLAVWAALAESGLLYPCAAALVGWFVFTVVRRLRRHWGDE